MNKLAYPDVGLILWNIFYKIRSVCVVEAYCLTDSYTIVDNKQDIFLLRNEAWIEDIQHRCEESFCVGHGTGDSVSLNLGTRFGVLSPDSSFHTSLRALSFLVFPSKYNAMQCIFKVKTNLEAYVWSRRSLGWKGLHSGAGRQRLRLQSIFLHRVITLQSFVVELHATIMTASPQ